MSYALKLKAKLNALWVLIQDTQDADRKKALRSQYYDLRQKLKKQEYFESQIGVSE